MKKCPFCWEKIQSEARKCRHCWEWLDFQKNEKIYTSRTDSINIWIKWIKKYWIGIVVVLWIVWIWIYNNWIKQQDILNLNNSIYDADNNVDSDALNKVNNTNVVSSQWKQIKSAIQNMLSNEIRYMNAMSGLNFNFYSSYFKNVYQLESLISNYKLYKEYNSEYLNNLINLANKYSFDLNSTAPYTFWEKVKKIKQLMSDADDFADKAISQIQYLIEIQSYVSIDDDWNLSISDNNMLNNYNSLRIDMKSASSLVTKESADLATYNKAFIQNTNNGI